MAMLKKSLSNKEALLLKIPADPSFVSTARMVLAAQLREKTADEEAIDDMKLVLSEFLAKAIEAKLVDEYFSIRMLFNDEGKEMQIFIEELEEFDPGQLFNSPYLSFTAIKDLVDHFDLELIDRQLFALKIAKVFN